MSFILHKTVGRNPKSIDLGLMQRMFLPIYHITHQPFFPHGAKREMRDNNGKLLYSARNIQIREPFFHYENNGKIITIPLFVLENNVLLTIKNLKNNGGKNLKIQQVTTELPKFCPSCDHEGTATCKLDTRYETQPRFVRIHYNHNKPKKDRCYVGTYDAWTGTTKSKEGIDIRKFFRSYWLISKFNGFVELPIPKVRKIETTTQILKRLEILSNL